MDNMNQYNQHKYDTINLIGYPIWHDFLSSRLVSLVVSFVKSQKSKIRLFSLIRGKQY